MKAAVSQAWLCKFKWISFEYTWSNFTQVIPARSNEFVSKLTWSNFTQVIPEWNYFRLISKIIHLILQNCIGFLASENALEVMRVYGGVQKPLKILALPRRGGGGTPANICLVDLTYCTEVNLKWSSQSWQCQDFERFLYSHPSLTWIISTTFYIAPDCPFDIISSYWVGIFTSQSHSGKICKKDLFTMETMEIYDYNVLVISFRTLQSQHIW